MSYLRKVLDGSDKRMTIVATVASIANRRNKSMEIEKDYSEGEILTLLVSILSLIMEVNLEGREECTLALIGEFIKKFLGLLGKELSHEESEVLTRYLIKDILQNKGKPLYYPIYHFGEGTEKKEIAIRLITDKIGKDGQLIYDLTDQGYNLMFRTKEVDEELDFKIENFKLQMQIKKKNYEQGITTSKEMLKMVMGKQKEVKEFVETVRQNVRMVSGKEYAKILTGVNTLLSEEYEDVHQTLKLVEESRNRLLEDEAINNPTEAIQEARKKIGRIETNVYEVLNLQRKLIAETSDMGKIYREFLTEAMRFSQVKIYPYEEVILRPLERLEFDFDDESGADALIEAMGVFLPLFPPQCNKFFDVATAYGEHAKTHENKETREEIVELEDNAARKEWEALRIRVHNRIIKLFITYAKSHPEGFLFSEFFKHIQSEEMFDEMIRDRVVFLDMLYMYEIEEIDIEKWLGDAPDDTVSIGYEFDLSHGLFQLYKENELKGLKSIRITRLENTFSHIIEDEEKESMMKVEVNDFKVEVTLSGTSSSDF